MVWNIPREGALDFVSVGALVHRVRPRGRPVPQGDEVRIHVSGGEFNVAANLADCFGMQTGIATAMADYPIGDLIAERVRAMGVKPFYKPSNTTAYRSQHGDGLQRPRARRARTRRLLQPCERGGGAAQARRL